MNHDPKQQLNLQTMISVAVLLYIVMTIVRIQKIWKFLHYRHPIMRTNHHIKNRKAKSVQRILLIQFFF